MNKLPPRIRLRALRRRAGLSPLQLAAALGCHVDSVRGWERLAKRRQSTPNGRLGVALQRWSREQGDEILPSDWHVEVFS